ncbi:flagellar basal-body MS-ring/collar protein FliF [Effusibacillus dendaii]|uniref:Flagellar M-ring protein n=1 Tax=Effusibacillus dendaii TaxID=2743772 RepID=A0A7I8D567_9BACL|nr:flagellar basal-body MS-ring/collar protein FliF [Effusibacillus dendaii]BCJ85258.1 flagellar M-ring protein [Effusibacillus dendaii]
MNQQIRELIGRLSEYWKQLEPHQRRNLMIAGIFFVITVALLSWFAFRPNYVAVYSNLEANAAGEIVAKLDEMKIPNQVQGTSVLVPEQYADRARVQLAMNNLPQTGYIDFGIFNQQSVIGMTENEFNVKYLNALQGSIANTIRSVQGIQDAQVHIVMQDQTLFLKPDRQDAKASVLLKVAPGVKLTHEQVLGIRQLVSGSVQGLKPENITIIDQNGVRLLEDGEQPNNQTGPGADKELQVRKQIRQDYEQKIRNALERMYGYGNVEVIVNPEVSFDKVQRTDEQYASPIQGSDQGIVRSEQRTSESTQNTAAPVTGPAGNATNNVNSQTKSATGSNSSTDKRTQTTNYEINKSIIQTAGQAFTVKKVSVSVLLNGTVNNQQKQDITNLVATAIGYKNDGTNNTDITVMGSTFQAPQNPFQPAWYQNPWAIGGIVAGLLLLGGGAYVIARRRRAASEEEDLQPVPVSQVPVLPEETSQQRMRKQLEKMVNQKPEEFTNLLRTWLAEE